MNKKIILSSFASLLFLSQAANAEIKIGKGSLTFNTGVASNYISRGVEQNRARPAPFAGADFTIPAGDFGLYLGTWFSASDGTDSHSYEYDVYAGVTKTIGIATFDVGYLSYMYPNASTKAAEQTAEYYGKLTIAPDKQPYTFGLAYFVDDTDGVRTTDTPRKDSQGTYYEANATYNFGPVQSKISYGIWENDTNTTSITLSKEFATINFDLSYIKAEADNRNQSSLATFGDKEYVVLQAKKVF